MIILTPITRKAVKWVNANVRWEDWQRIGTGIATETRMAEPIVEAMLSKGLKEPDDFEAVRR